MDKKIENNRHYKEEPLKKNNCLNVINTAEYNDAEKHNRKPFTAWPCDKLNATHENYGIEIIEGRTKSGGYVAYPKKELVKSKMSVIKKQCF